MDGVYTHGSAGYSTITTNASNRHCVGVAVLYWALLRFDVEAIHHFDPNVVILKLMMGDWRWYIIGYYLAPNDASTI